ncbi:MAG: hypothetical protein JRN39_06230 [Nitrososphaerota archaeon]|nr:hypothetical protein [Nitrososphaerota archaeon]
MKRFVGLAVLLILVSVLPASLQHGGPAMGHAASQPAVQYSVDQYASVDQFGWVLVNTTLTLTNNGQSPSGPLPVSLLYPTVAKGTLWSYAQSNFDLLPYYSQNSTSFNGTVSSVPAGGTLNATLSLRLRGIILEPYSGVYAVVLTSWPNITLPQGEEANATTTFSLPRGVNVLQTVTQPTSINLTQVPAAGQVWTYTNKTQPFRFGFYFSSSGATSFALYTIESLHRTVVFNPEGGLTVVDRVTILGQDATPLSTITLTDPAKGEYYIAQGAIHASAVKIPNGQVNLPSPIPNGSVSTLIISYALPPNETSRAAGGLGITLGGLQYPNLVQNYTVDYSFPAGSTVRFLTQRTYANVTGEPVVRLEATVPWSWDLAPALPVGLVGVAFFAALYTVALRRKKAGAPQELIDRKKKVVLGLLEDMRLRGEGFIPYTYFSDQRRFLEASRGEVSSRVNEARNRAKTDKSYRGTADTLYAADARLEQIYREGKTALEDKVGGKVSADVFKKKMAELESRV